MHILQGIKVIDGSSDKLAGHSFDLKATLNVLEMVYNHNSESHLSIPSKNRLGGFFKSEDNSKQLNAVEFLDTLKGFKTVAGYTDPLTGRYVYFGMYTDANNGTVFFSSSSHVSYQIHERKLDSLKQFVTSLHESIIFYADKKDLFKVIIRSSPTYNGGTSTTIDLELCFMASVSQEYTYSLPFSLNNFTFENDIRTGFVQRASYPFFVPLEFQDDLISNNMNTSIKTYQVMAQQDGKLRKLISSIRS